VLLQIIDIFAVDGFAIAQTILNEGNLIAGEQVNVTSGTASDVLNRPTTTAQGSGNEGFCLRAKYHL